MNGLVVDIWSIRVEERTRCESSQGHYRGVLPAGGAVSPGLSTNGRPSWHPVSAVVPALAFPGVPLMDARVQDAGTLPKEGGSMGLDVDPQILSVHHVHHILGPPFLMAIMGSHWVPLDSLHCRYTPSGSSSFSRHFSPALASCILLLLLPPLVPSSLISVCTRLHSFIPLTLTLFSSHRLRLCQATATPSFFFFSSRFPD